MGLLSFLGVTRSQDRDADQGVQNVRGVEIKTIEVGSSGTEIFSGYINEEYLNELRGRDWADKVDKMRRSDAQVKGALSALKLPLKSSNWYLQVTEQSDEAEMQKRLLEKALFEDIGKSFTKLVGEILTCLDFGYSLFEITHQVKENDPDLGTYNTLKGIAWRSQRTLDRWQVDPETGQLLCVSQWVVGDLGRYVELDSRFLLHFAPEQEGDNFEGISVLRPMYGNYLRKNAFLKLLAAGIEKYAIPTPMLEVPESKGDSPEFHRAVAVLKKYTSNQANYITFPAGWKLEINNVIFDAEKLRICIDYENKEMLMSVLATFLSLGQGGSGGSRALSEDLSDFFTQTVQYIADHISEQIQRRVMLPLVKMNFGDSALKVELRCDGLNEKADKAWADTLKVLKDSGLVDADKALKDFIRDKYKLPESAEELSPDGSNAETAVQMPVQGTAAENVQQQVLNGAQVTSLIAIVQGAAAGTIPRESAIEMIVKAYNVNSDEASRIIGPAGQGFKIDPSQVAQSPKQFAEQRWSKQSDVPVIIRGTAKSLQGLYEPNLRYLGSDLINRLMKGDTDSLRTVLDVEVGSTASYVEAVRHCLTKAAYEAKQTVEDIAPRRKTLQEFRLGQTKAQRLSDLERQIDKMAKVLTQASKDFAVNPSSQAAKEAFTKAMLDYAEAAKAARLLYEDIGMLGQTTISSIRSRADFVVQTQAADLQKVIGLQWQTSSGSTDSDSLLRKDLDERLDKFLESPVITTGSSVMASQVVNDARLASVEELGLDDEVESYTFIAVDDEKTTDICRELDGRTFAPDDSDLDRYSPPLHYNCRSYLAINMRSFKGNPDVDTEALALSKSAIDSINLAEKSHGRMRF